MSATSVTLRGRAKAESLMQDACTVKRLTGSASDPDTGVVTPTYTTVYTGRCKVQQVPSGAQSTVGEATITQSPLTLHIPASATGPTTDDIATITACVLDPELVGRVFHLTAPAHKSFATARRLPMSEVTS